jgi:hypothetical protein
LLSPLALAIQAPLFESREGHQPNPESQRIALPEIASLPFRDNAAERVRVRGLVHASARIMQPIKAAVD